MIPVLKTGKDNWKATSYRPISLTSCVVKTIEQIINNGTWKVSSLLSRNKQGSESASALKTR